MIKRRKILKITLIAFAGLFFYIGSLMAVGILMSRAGFLEFFLALLPKQKVTGVNILAFGIDETQYVKRADTIMVLHLDPEHNRIGALSIPRDTRVHISPLGYTKINHTYAYGGVDLLRQSVSDFLGMPVDYYVKLDLKGMAKVVDVLGGVDVDVEKNLFYRDQAAGLMIHVNKGMQHLDGETAIQYLRFRQDREGDIGRIRRQQLFMQAIAKQITKPASLMKFPSLMQSMSEAVETDMSFLEVLGLGQEMADVFRTGLVVKDTVPGSVALIDGVSYWRPDIVKLDDVISGTIMRKTVSGSVTVERVKTQDRKASTEKRRLVKTEEVFRVAEQGDLTKNAFKQRECIVEVLNGTGRKNVAMNAAALIKKKGLKIKRYGNAGSFKYEKTLLVDWKGGLEKTLAIASLLQIDPQNIIVYDKPNKPLDVTLVVGKDWDTILAKMEQGKHE